MEEDKSEWVHKNINKQKTVKIEAEYEESSVSNEVLIYFNIFECDRDILNRIEVTYEQVCMATPRYKYYEKMLETLVDCIDHPKTPFYNEKLWQAISRVLAETEEKEYNKILDANNMTMDTFCQPPWAYHLWTWLLLVWTWPIEQRHQLNRLLSELKHQTLLHWHEQQIFQHYQQNHQIKKEKRTYKRTRSQTHHRQTQHCTNLILWMIQIPVNQIQRNLWSTYRLSKMGGENIKEFF